MSDSSNEKKRFAESTRINKSLRGSGDKNKGSLGAERSRNHERKKRIEESIKKSTPLSLPKKNKNPLASFLYYPDRVRFANKDPEEEIILLLRKHPLTNVKGAIISILMILAPAFLTVMPFFEVLPVNFQIISVVVWYMITTAFIFETFLSWFFNVNIVTDERIVEVDFYNLIYRELTDANIDKIEDVTVKIGGAIRTYFNYGDIEIQTAADVPRIDFEAIPKPDLVAKIIRDLRVEEEQEKIEGRVR
jgi:hypothetical protein